MSTRIKPVEKALQISKEMIPILVMVGCVPFIQNDWILSGVYILIITGSFLFKYEKNEWIFFVFGFFVMIFFECLFISTGVEIFERRSLLGLMPVWLPILWAYGFVAMKRANNVLK